VGSFSDGTDYARYERDTNSWYAVRNSDETITLVNAKVGVASERPIMQDTIDSILQSIDYRVPSQTLTGPQRAVDTMIDAIYSDNDALVYISMCPADAAALLLFLGSFDAMTDALAGGSNTPYTAPPTESYTADRSGLYYETIYEKDGRAVVRLMGNVRLVYTDGTEVIRPMDTAVGPFLSRIGTNAYGVSASGGNSWQVCSNIIGL
jgi:hypothetical protein